MKMKEYNKIFDLLNSYVDESQPFHKCYIYENSFDIIKQHIPEHGYTNGELEDITTFWLDGE